jgi:hypothetical protein
MKLRLETPRVTILGNKPSVLGLTPLSIALALQRTVLQLSDQVDKRNGITTCSAYTDIDH